MKLNATVWTVRVLYFACFMKRLSVWYCITKDSVLQKGICCSWPCQYARWKIFSIYINRGKLLKTSQRSIIPIYLLGVIPAGSSVFNIFPLLLSSMLLYHVLPTIVQMLINIEEMSAPRHSSSLWPSHQSEESRASHGFLAQFIISTNLSTSKSVTKKATPAETSSTEQWCAEWNTVLVVKQWRAANNS